MVLSGRKFIGNCLCLSLVWFMVLTSMGYAGDLLEQSTLQLKNPSKSTLIDVTRAGERLVAVGERGIVIYSDDNGSNWTQARVPVRVTLTAVTFPHPDNGWVVGHDSIVLHSSDKGESWQKVMDGCKINQMMVAAMKVIVEQKRQQFELADASKKSELQYVVEDAEFNLKGFMQTEDEGPTKPLLDVLFFNQQEGLIVGAFGIILSTNDGGRSWSPSLDRIENQNGYHFYALARTQEALFLFGEAGIMFRSQDNGEHWQTLETVYEGSFFGALGDFEGDCVVACGLRGNMVSSCDAGQTWQHQQIGPQASLNAGVFLDGRQYLLAGMPAAVFGGNVTKKGVRSISTKFPGCMGCVISGDQHLVMVGLGGVLRLDLKHDTVKEVN